MAKIFIIFKYFTHQSKKVYGIKYYLKYKNNIKIKSFIKKYLKYKKYPQK
jgi:hypothetical protein